MPTGMVATTVLVAVLMTETVLDSLFGHINACAIGSDCERRSA